MMRGLGFAPMMAMRVAATPIEIAVPSSTPLLIAASKFLARVGRTFSIEYSDMSTWLSFSSGHCNLEQVSDAGAPIQAAASR